MNPQVRGLIRLLVLVAVMVLFFMLFPAAYRFAEGASRSVMRLWWLVLLVALACWLIWGIGRRPKDR
jgi:hypothetical protein